MTEEPMTYEDLFRRLRGHNPMCPHCGRCPVCGHRNGNHWPRPEPWYEPAEPWYEPIWVNRATC